MMSFNFRQRQWGPNRDGFLAVNKLENWTGTDQSRENLLSLAAHRSLVGLGYQGKKGKHKDTQKRFKINEEFGSHTKFVVCDYKMRPCGNKG